MTAAVAAHRPPWAQDGVLVVDVLEQTHAEVHWAVVHRRDLIGGGRRRHQLACLVPPQLFHGEPSHTLDEGALDLPDVDGGVDGMARIM